MLIAVTPFTPAITLLLLVKVPLGYMGSAVSTLSEITSLVRIVADFVPPKIPTPLPHPGGAEFPLIMLLLIAANGPVKMAPPAHFDELPMNVLPTTVRSP